MNVYSAADVNSEHPPKMPRKKFQWSNELRERLYEVYQARWTSYAVLGKRKDSLEQFIAGYMKDKVVDLWATGWMRYEELQREIDRHKNASKKLKEKAKRLSTSSAQTGATQATTTAAGSTATTANINYLKQIEELTTTDQSRSRANSDTDSATSASSNSIKRKLDFVSGVRKSDGGGGSGGGGAKPPKIKFHKQLVATLAQMSQISPAAMGVESLPPGVVNNYLKQYEDLTVTTQQTLSRGNSDTDSVASASSNSLKRKLEAATVAVTVGAGTQTQISAKPAKKKCTKQQQQPRQQQQPSTQLDPLLTQPSTSAQAAALNAAVAAAAASMLELASPTKQAAAVDHTLFSLITAATLSNSPTASVVSAPIISHPSLVASSVHSTTTNSRPTVPHVINLDDYKSPSDILQTSQQLAATTTTTKWQPPTVCSPVTPPVVRCESSSESDGVEIVGVFPAAAKAQARKSNTNAKPRSKPSQQKSKATSVIVPVNGVNGATALGYNLENMYVYNNNNAVSNKLDGGGVIRTAVSGTAVGSTTSLPYDVTKSPQILAKLSELSALEKRINWSPLMSANCDLKAAAGVAQASTPPSQASSAGTGAGVGQATNQ